MATSLPVVPIVCTCHARWDISFGFALILISMIRNYTPMNLKLSKLVLSQNVAQVGIFTKLKTN